MKNIVRIFFFLLLISISCTQNNLDQKHIIKKEIYTDGSIKKEISYLNDTVIDGVVKYYYKNGTVGSELFYLDGNMHGLQKDYYESGNIKHKAYLKNGIKEGEDIYYYKNGKIESKKFWLNNKQFGDAYWYYENGVLETFNSFDFQQHCRYLIKYDSTGNKIQEEGIVVGQFLLDGQFDSIPVNKPMFAKLSVANPPNTKVLVAVGELEKNGDIKFDTLPVKDNMAPYTHTFNKKGKHTLMRIGQMKDLRGNVIFQDTSKIEITVID
jgi:MORN repeat variant